MTIETWIEEFYPTTATEHKGVELTEESKLAATEHSLRKWRGLTEENLKKHGVRLDGNRDVVDHNIAYPVFQEKSVSIDSNSCALCQLTDDDCNFCPIVQMRGYRCDVSPDWGGGTNEWSIFTVRVDPNPMIKLLEDTRAYLLAEMPNPPKEDENSL